MIKMMALFLWLSTFSIMLWSPVYADNGLEQAEVAKSTDYLEALQLANIFLFAWIRRDAETGISMVSLKLRDNINDKSWLYQYFSGISEPHHQAFEIGNGKKQADGGYSFPVVLYEYADNGPLTFSDVGTLKVSKENTVWRVSELPKSSDNHQIRAESEDSLSFYKS